MLTRCSAVFPEWAQLIRRRRKVSCLDVHHDTRNNRLGLLHRLPQDLDLGAHARMRPAKFLETHVRRNDVAGNRLRSRGAPVALAAAKRSCTTGSSRKTEAITCASQDTMLCEECAVRVCGKALPKGHRLRVSNRHKQLEPTWPERRWLQTCTQTHMHSHARSLAQSPDQARKRAMCSSAHPARAG